MKSLLYELSNGNDIRVYTMCDDPDYEYGYDYFDGDTKKLIDGGVFNMTGEKYTEDDVVSEAMRWCDVDPGEVYRNLIGENVEYEDLEEMGYSGF